MATNPRQAERKSSDLGHETRKATDQAGQTGRTMVDAAERTTRAGAEAFRRGMPKASKKQCRAELKQGAALRNDLWNNFQRCSA